MKKIIIFLSISLSLHAQIDSLKTTFSEEKVEKFEKTTLIDEYDKAFGGNRVVKRALRFRIEEPKNSTFTGLSSQFEQKLNTNMSVIGSFYGGYSSRLGFNYNLSMEGRWYYQMKNRIALEKQKANVTGNFISIKAKHDMPGVTDQPSVKVLSLNTFQTSSDINPVYIYKNSLSLQWGKQLGNNIEFGLSTGLKQGREFFSTITDYSNSNQLREPITVTNKIIPYFSTFTQVGLGFMFPKKAKEAIKNCEFIKCNYAVNNMFKLNLNDAIYMDKYVQKIKTDLGYEHRIGKSNITINAFISVGLSNFKVREVLLFKDTTVIVNDRSFKTYLPSYGKRNINDLSLNFSETTQLRYYIRKKENATRNLNGWYTGVENSIRFNKFYKNNSYPGYAIKGNRNTSFSGIMGYQTQTSLGTYVDFTASIGLESINSRVLIDEKSINTKGFKQAHIEWTIKLGLAR